MTGSADLFSLALTYLLPSGALALRLQLNTEKKFCNEGENTYLRKSDEELDDVGDEPRDVADEKDADDDGGGARDADGAGVGHAALPAS